MEKSLVILWLVGGGLLWGLAISLAFDKYWKGVVVDFVFGTALLIFGIVWLLQL